jgi:uncharacterized protein (UPF0305 family)
MSLFRNPSSAPAHGESLVAKCRVLKNASTRGELGERISRFVLACSPSDIQRMKWAFETKVRDLTPEYRDRLTAKITEHLLGTYQRIRLADQEGLFRTLREPVPEDQKNYWDMVAGQCGTYEGGDEPRIRFLKYLLAGYCMLVRGEPGHPAGTPFPGGDMVEFMDGVYYCPVRDKAGDVDAALCPFCPARQTPGIGYLQPAAKPTERNKQEFIEDCHRFHHFNG